jgi:plastocyanin
MNIRPYMLTAFAVAAAATSMLAETPPDASRSTFTVSGEASLIAVGSRDTAKDASRIVVWLTPIDTVQPVSTTTTARAHYRLQQRNKRFEPGLLVVPVGSVVDFPNYDPWFHNVFSLYQGKRFDLGLYQAGAKKSVSFDRIGPSYLFCNIHSEMTGVVLVVDSDLFGVTEKNGHYSIPRVTPGRYVLHVWYENATPEFLQALQRQVTIQNDNQALPGISVKAAKHVPVEHKNKYGQDYDPETLKTDY